MSAPVAARTLTSTFRSMASEIELRVVDPRPGADRAIERAAARIEAVARHLTRFDAGSALSRANASPAAWHEVPVELSAAVDEAARAHRETGGLFDPRVLDALLTWGYDRTFAQVAGAALAVDPGGSDDPAGLPGVPDGLGATARPVPAEPWQPTVLPGRDAAQGGLLNLGGTPIDLGGIGKGLAARWAAAELDGAGGSVLVDAGGDEWLGGPGPDGDGWLVGVEDPFGQGGTDEEPILVLALTDLGVATSSVRRRRWRTGAAAVHHLVHPRTGLPGGSGLAQVTVVHPDPAWAEVWSKTLFLTGPDEVAAQAEARGLSAAWVTADGVTRTSPAMDQLVIWRAQ